MGCIKLSILDEQYKKTEIRVSYNKKELTFNFCDNNTESFSFGGFRLGANNHLFSQFQNFPI